MVKPVSLSNEAYEVLSKMKSEGESFSDVVMRITNEKKFRFEKYAGIWKDRTDLDRIQKDIERGRKTFKLRRVKF